MAPQKGSTKAQIKPAVMEYLVRNAGVNVFRKDIAEATGFTETQITACIGNLYYHDTDGAKSEGKLEIIVNGHQWRWHEKPRKATGDKRLFEELAVTRSGQILVEGEDGTVYRLEEL